MKMSQAFILLSMLIVLHLVTESTAGKHGVDGGDPRSATGYDWAVAVLRRSVTEQYNKTGEVHIWYETFHAIGLVVTSQWVITTTYSFRQIGTGADSNKIEALLNDLVIHFNGRSQLPFFKADRLVAVTEHHHENFNLEADRDVNDGLLLKMARKVPYGIATLEFGDLNTRHPNTFRGGFTAVAFRMYVDLVIGKFVWDLKPEANTALCAGIG